MEKRGYFLSRDITTEIQKSSPVTLMAILKGLSSQSNVMEIWYTTIAKTKRPNV